MSTARDSQPHSAAIPVSIPFIKTDHLKLALSIVSTRLATRYARNVISSYKGFGLVEYQESFYEKSDVWSPTQLPQIILLELLDIAFSFTVQYLLEKRYPTCFQGAIAWSNVFTKWLLQCIVIQKMLDYLLGDMEILNSNQWFIAEDSSSFRIKFLPVMPLLSYFVPVVYRLQFADIVTLTCTALFAIALRTIDIKMPASWEKMIVDAMRRAEEEEKAARSSAGLQPS